MLALVLCVTSAAFAQVYSLVDVETVTYNEGGAEGAFIYTIKGSNSITSLNNYFNLLILI